MEILWCWRCKKNVPMINEEERKALWNHSDDEAVMTECQRLTGLPRNLTTRKLMLSHRRSRYGQPCPNCGKLYRTVNAKFCAQCGHKNQS